MSQYNQNFVFNGLGTLAFSVPNAGLYKLDGKIQLPRIAAGVGQSACLCVVNQNGSPVYTGIAGADGLAVELTCAANDAITVVLSSSAAADAPLNVIKAEIQISQGQ